MKRSVVSMNRGEAAQHEAMAEKQQNLLRHEGGGNAGGKGIPAVLPKGSASRKGTDSGKPALGTVDEWLQVNQSESTLNVVVLGAAAKGSNHRNPAKQAAGVRENVFGQREEPRRSQPRSVVAPEEVNTSPSKESVVFAMTFGTMRTTDQYSIPPTSSDLENMPYKSPVFHPPSTTRRKVDPVQRSVTAPAFLLPTITDVKSTKSTRSKRPALDRKKKRRPEMDDDDNMSIGNMSIGSQSISSAGTRVYHPPVMRNDKINPTPPPPSWSVLHWVGQPAEQTARSSAASTASNASKRGSLTEQLFGSDEGNEIPSKVPATDPTMAKIRLFLCSSSFLYGVIFFGMASGLLYGVLSGSYYSYSLSDMDISIDWNEELNVAFIGNSYFFINDIPRVMETISDYHIYQESVIHSSGGSLGNILLTGNGMYSRWKTDESILETYLDDDGDNVTIYDYGLCSVAQVLNGYDDILSYGNGDAAYYDDGKNPCIQNENYFNYIDDKLSNSSFAWDYVVLVDQTKRMAVEEARSLTVYALANAYGPLIKATGAIPVIVDTHAFWSNSTNMTGLVDIPTFQSLIYDGVQDYVDALAYVLPDWQAPIVAPVGLAFLVVYEEDNDLWQKLFIGDDIHSSVHGTYLFACVLYATMYGHLPRRSTNSQVDSLFTNSRLLVGKDVEYPSAQEAFYYRRVAKRVALDGYVPSLMSRR
jgi:hypothetical protein